MNGREYRVALVTCAAHPELAPDDRVLADALHASGIHPVAACWDAPGTTWQDYDAVILRSTWDYHRRPVEFLAWLDRLAAQGVPLWNPPEVVRWNMRKTYLRELTGAGIPVVPTVWATGETESTLAGLVAAEGWDRVVVKPSISATAFETWRAGREIGPGDEARFEAQRREREMMVQPFVPEIETDGELSLVFLGGSYSHAVRKRARQGDFRVQTDFGGTVEPADPPPEIQEQAARVARLTPAPCLYARVDGCLVGGRLLLMELEVTEPVLFFREVPGAAGRFVAALRERLSRPRPTRPTAA